MGSDGFKSHPKIVSVEIPESSLIFEVRFCVLFFCESTVWASLNKITHLEVF